MLDRLPGVPTGARLAAWILVMTFVTIAALLDAWAWACGLTVAAFVFLREPRVDRSRGRARHERRVRAADARLARTVLDAGTPLAPAAEQHWRHRLPSITRFGCWVAALAFLAFAIIGGGGWAQPFPGFVCGAIPLWLVC